MDPSKFKSRMGDLALGSALGAAARDYKKEMEAQCKTQEQPGAPAHEDLDFDELMDDPELDKLHAERLASLKKEAEKRLVLSQKGHGDFREVTEGEFLSEVTASQRLVCHFFHKEFVRCKIMDKHLLSLAIDYFDTKFIKINAETCPFFVTRLVIKVLPCVILFRDGVAIDRIVGFDELGGNDDFPRRILEARLLSKDVIVRNQNAEVDSEDRAGNVRSTCNGSDSD